ncbi:heme peroxidase [Bombardia bombarda]|uniref:Heme peroxidase n=1 Tax=Bombardia bombarda TaxID=252184 RepID=A0AA39WIA9_9PEZI|nr:heme peroxidase [Bombardia bombarda]
MRLSVSALAGLLSLGAELGLADPTWPAATDEMEEIVYQLQGVKGRLFNDVITPCNNEAAGPGRVTASEWLRVGFHDMATANRYFGTGGIDASLQFELNSGENTGPGHNTTLIFYSNYYSARSSMADLIAAGVYASVRSCGGPIIPLRLGRVDATFAGSTGVPQPQNSVVTFQQQFDRMGFNTTEMIQVTACGHTIGGVHSTEFPEIVPVGTGVNGQIGLDTSDAVFDNKVVTEYNDGTTANPLVVGPSISVGRNSDTKVFNADGNVTMKALASVEAFTSICQTVLQKMIEVVPTGVTLTSPITPYMVKPVGMQLTLNPGGSTLLLTGYIRVLTTNLPTSSITNLVLTWKDRTGGNNCGSSGSCSTTATLQGVGRGFDDTFGFFPISTIIYASAGISSFTVTINLSDGTSQFYDNNGNSYPLTDAIILQKPQSCLLQTTGALTASALVRNDVTLTPVNLGVSYLVPRGVTRSGNPVPILSSATIAMTKGDCVGAYTFYTANYTITGGRSYNAKLSVTAGSGTSAVTDDFNNASDLAGTCIPFSGGGTCDGGNGTTSSSSSISSTTTVTSSSSTITSSTISSTITTGTITTSTTPTPTPTTPAIKPTVGNYTFIACWTEGTTSRALTGAAFAYDGMTLESCMANCTGFDYWGTEYGRECYCGNALAATSAQAPDTAECNFACSGDASEFCGAGNRIELYSTTATRTTATSSSTAAPTATLAVKSKVGGYVFVGCWTEPGSGGRALSGGGYVGDNVTLEGCAGVCGGGGFGYFGAEFGRECYCGNSLAAGSVSAPLSDCSMTCAGDSYEYCGGSSRLELYSLTGTVANPSQPANITAPSSTAGGDDVVWQFYNCMTEVSVGRALGGQHYADGNMTLESCGAFCEGSAYFGAEYGRECYCGDGFTEGSVVAPGGVAECDLVCAGNGGEYCGAGGG